MRNVKVPPVASLARSTGADVLERVIGIAAAPLLPGEAEADYLSVAERIIVVAQPKDAIEDFLTRDAVDLTWEIFRLRRLKAGLLRASTSSGVSNVMDGSASPSNPRTCSVGRATSPSGRTYGLTNDLGREPVTRVADSLHPLGYRAASGTASATLRDNAGPVHAVGDRSEILDAGPVIPSEQRPWL
jgi:hypothetical protein